MTACPYCDCEMVARWRHRAGRAIPTNIRTRDHIRPKTWGGDDTAENLRYCCRRCNELRAQLGHCVGALACVLAVARGSRRPMRSVRFIAVSWRLPMLHRIAGLSP